MKKFFKKWRLVFLVLTVVAGIFCYAWFSQAVILKPTNTDADKISIIEIHADFNHPAAATSTAEKMHILIVPGHEPDYGGTHFLGVYERDLVSELADDLNKFLMMDPKYDATTTRSTTAWAPEFSSYFKTDWKDIISWEKSAKKVSALIKPLGGKSAPAIEHITAKTNVAIRLYGITKWANENNTDLMVHIHLNDDPDRRVGKAGVYTGIAIYTPARQYDNSAITRSIADSVFERLTQYDPVAMVHLKRFILGDMFGNLSSVQDARLQRIIQDYLTQKIDEDEFERIFQEPLEHGGVGFMGIDSAKLTEKAELVQDLILL